MRLRQAVRTIQAIALIHLISCSGKPHGNQVAEKATYSDAPVGSQAAPETPAAAAPPVAIRSQHRDTRQNTDSLQVSRYIRCIFQDRDGNLWFGTVGDGVVRYDGTTLRYFTPADGFGGFSVQDIRQDSRGDIWFATEGGLTRYHPRDRASIYETGSFAFRNYTETDGLNHKSLWSLCIDPADRLWIGTFAGVNICDLTAGTDDSLNMTALPIPGSEQNIEIKSILFDGMDRAWIATDGAGVYRYSDGKLQRFSTKNGLAHDRVRHIAADASGNIWFATLGGGLSKHDPRGILSGNAPLFYNFVEQKGNNRVSAILIDREDRLWISLSGEARRYDHASSLLPSERSFLRISAEDGLTNTALQSIYEDKAGNIWFGSGNGLFRYNKENQNNPCRLHLCVHDLKRHDDSVTHYREISKTVINVLKAGPWPARFRR